MASLKTYETEYPIKSKTVKDYQTWGHNVLRALHVPVIPIQGVKHRRTAMAHWGGIGILNSPIQPILRRSGQSHRIVKIALPPWAQTKLVILHDIVHVLQGHWEIPQRHNKEFREVLVYLVGDFISEKKAGQLRRAYKKIYVKEIW